MVAQFTTLRLENTPSYFSTINQVIPKLHEDDEELLLQAIRKFTMAQPLESIPPIIAPIDLDFPFAPVIVPERGEKIGYFL